MIRRGQTFIGGRSQHMARSLLDAAERLGADPRVVRTVGDGYIVPTEVADLASQTTQEEWSSTTLVNKRGETVGKEQELVNQGSSQEDTPNESTPPVDEPSGEDSEAADPSDKEHRTFSYLDDMSLNELRAEAGRLNLPAGGGKADLRERIIGKLTNEGSE